MFLYLCILSLCLCMCLCVVWCDREKTRMMLMMRYSDIQWGNQDGWIRSMVVFLDGIGRFENKMN